MNYYVKGKPFYNSHEFIELTLIKKSLRFSKFSLAPITNTFITAD